jgi:hypothetical protein
LFLPDNVRQSAEFMKLIRQAHILHADRSVARDTMAQRLRILEMKKDQQNPEDIQAMQEALQKAEDALRDALVIMDSLKAAVAKLTLPTASTDAEEESGNQYASEDDVSTRSTNLSG